MRNPKNLCRTKLLFCSVTLLMTGCSLFQPTPPPPPPPASLVSANQALASNMPDAAISDAQAYLHSNPYGPLAAQAWYIQGRGYEQKISNNPNELDQNLVQAHSCYLQALQQNPAPAVEGDVHASLSNVTFFQDDFAESIRQASLAISLVASPQVKANLLFRKGVSQQRLGEFTDADQTFRQVEQKYPGTPVAEAAHQHEGLNSFYVQLATYSTRDAAERGAASLSATGIVVSQRTDAKGQTIVDDGPFATYADAKKVKLQVQKNFPQALIVP